MTALLRWPSSVLDRLFAPMLNPASCLPTPPETFSPESSPADRTAAGTLLRRLNLRLRHRLTEAEPGGRRSLLRGQGLDFAELREYHPGDDIRKIDWNVLARTLTPHVREYHDEKRQTLWIAADCTASMQFGRQRRKADHVIAIAGYIGLLACRNGHRLGALLLTDEGPEILPPSTANEATVQRLLSRLLAATQSSASTAGIIRFDPEKVDPLTAGCRQLAYIVPKQATLFFLSDFLPGLSPEAAPHIAPARTESGEDLFDWQRALGRLSRRTRLIYLPIFDPVEMELPPGLGRLSVIDPETGHMVELDTDDVRFRTRYALETRARQARLLTWLGRTGQVVSASTEVEALDILLALLKGEATVPRNTSESGKPGP